MLIMYAAGLRCRARSIAALLIEFTVMDSCAVRWRDSNDLAVLGTAVAGHADLLVSGDKDLLVLREHAGIPIVTPRACYERLR
jgi:predicted nucleic acid-binding protein